MVNLIYAVYISVFETFKNSLNNKSDGQAFLSLTGHNNFKASSSEISALSSKLYSLNFVSSHSDARWFFLSFLMFYNSLKFSTNVQVRRIIMSQPVTHLGQSV